MTGHHLIVVAFFACLLAYVNFEWRGKPGA
ncbi:MAG: hypothetical protein JWN75_1250 [Candidatus Saccharibacteria bacterium]|nr:hypothetical protein [Candidatus Saccharibacteria bacterium]